MDWRQSWDAWEVSAEPELLTRIRRVRSRLAEFGPTESRAEGDFERVALPSHYCDVLRDLLLFERARVVIEIGLAYGSSALAIGEALAGQPDARHLIIDPFQNHFKNAGWDAIIEAGLDHVTTLVAERSQIALPRLASERFVADGAFVDGSHTFHHVFVDLYYLGEIVRPGGLIILDDCDWPSVANAVRYFEINTGWHAEAGGVSPRLRTVRLPDPRVEPRFEDFKRFGT
jgi:predicted O-methyltransferase YrrM